MMAIGIPALRVLAVAYFVSIPNLVFAAALQGFHLPFIFGKNHAMAWKRYKLLALILPIYLQQIISWFWVIYHYNLGIGYFDSLFSKS